MVEERVLQELFTENNDQPVEDKSSSRAGFVPGSGSDEKSPFEDDDTY